MIWDLIVGPFAGWIAGAVGALVLLTGAWWSGRRSGAVARDLGAARANAKARDDGRKAVAGAKADLRDGESPESIVRGNDGAWR